MYHAAFQKRSAAGKKQDGLTKRKKYVIIDEIKFLRKEDYYMKKVWKSFVFGILTVALTVGSATFGQGADTVPQPVDGAAAEAMMSQWNKNWYDSDGRYIMSLEGGYINGCPVLSGTVTYTLTETIGNFKIRESARIRDIQVKHSGMGMHEQLIIDDIWNLSPYSYDAYYESIGDVHLGMTMAAVEAIYGKPDRSRYTPQKETWYYDKVGFQMDFEVGRVVSVTFKSTSDRRLDRTGFDCKTAPEEFARLYPMGAVPAKGGVYYIADGEFLDFTNYPDALTLSIYNVHPREESDTRDGSFRALLGR